MGVNHALLLFTGNRWVSQATKVVWILWSLDHIELSILSTRWSNCEAFCFASR